MRVWMKNCLCMVLALCLILAIWPGIALADNPTLKRGDRSQAVQELQDLLKQKGFLKIDKTTDFFGKDTEKAVMALQKQFGMKVDGVVGKDTWAKLKKADSSTAKPDDGKLEIGDEGQDVKDLQTRLKQLGLLSQDRITGYFGELTKAAVIRFQESVGMTADGVVGKKTHEAIFANYKASTLVPGMKSDDVKKMQQRLKDLGYFTGSVTGLFGTATQKAVAYFQRGNGLTDDGIAGKATLDKLYSNKAVTEKDARRKGVSKTSSNSKPSSKIQKMIEFAKTLLGKPYVYGASGPDTFDCSGLTMYVFKKFGVQLPHSAYYQGYHDVGVKIESMSKLKPGDLVFFNSIKDGDLCDHVGIYIGGGNIIHAPQPGDVVKISSLNTKTGRKEFSWGRRILK